MGQKVNPNIIRLGIIRSWTSMWFAGTKTYADYLHDDILIRNIILEKLKHGFISQILIERLNNKLKIIINTSRPGIVIGKQAEQLEYLQQQIYDITNLSIQLIINEIKQPEIDAQLIAHSIAFQLKRRLGFRKIIKRTIQNALKLGIKGIKIKLSGRLGGAEIARTEWQREGQIPLHTFRGNVDYKTSQVLTNYGLIGIKVWLYRGEILTKIPLDYYPIINNQIIHNAKTAAAEADAARAAAAAAAALAAVK